MNEGIVRETLVKLLLESHAHATLDQAIADLEPGLRGRRPAPEIHSAWEELEHLRIAQEDILRYTLDPGWKSPGWPKGYWPARAEPRGSEWVDSVERFKSDLAEVVAMARDTKRDLTAAIPHGEGRTYLRQVLLVADHNAYHVGQIVQVRKLLGAWKS